MCAVACTGVSELKVSVYTLHFFQQTEGKCVLEEEADTVARSRVKLASPTHSFSNCLLRRFLEFTYSKASIKLFEPEPMPLILIHPHQ